MLVQVLEHLREPQLSETRCMQFISNTNFLSTILGVTGLLQIKEEKLELKKDTREANLIFYFSFHQKFKNGGRLILRA